ncbi:MAG TPA: hypothetical protein VMR54_13865 [Thermoanaerobaculia bacterium]|nr:hypothetical protein [Thermoanaerobaculia bacterium]
MRYNSEDVLTFRLLGVYFGAAAGCLMLARGFIRPIRLSAAVFLTLAPFLFAGKALLTAGVYGPIDQIYHSQPLAARRAEMGVGPTRTHDLVDVSCSMVPWQKAVREAVKNGRLPLWNRFAFTGEPLLAVLQHSALHPGTWIGFLLPLAQAWTFGMAFRMFLALAAMYLFLRELDCGEAPSLLGATAWAFSEFLFYFLEFPLQPVVSVFPLLLLGLRRLAVAPGRQALGITLVSLLLMISGGHPETLLHSVAGAGVYFLFELSRTNWKQRFSSVGLSVVAGGLALGLSAALLLPFREAANVTSGYAMRAHWYAKSDRSVPLTRSLRRSVKNVMPYVYGSWIDGGEDQTGPGPAAYAGSVLFPLVLVGLRSRRKEIWPFVIVGVLSASAWARLPIINDAICQLPLFDIAINEYMIFLAAFAVSCLAAFGLDRLGSGGGDVPSWRSGSSYLSSRCRSSSSDSMGVSAGSPGTAAWCFPSPWWYPWRCWVSYSYLF